MATASKTLTYEEYVQLPERRDGREEVVNGEVRVMPPPAFRHAEVIDNLVALLHAKIDRAVFRLVASSFGVIVQRDPLRVRNPDLAMFRKSELVVQDGIVHSAPELIVEVLSPSNSRAEMDERLADFHGIGVPEVWLVSPEAQTVEVLVLGETGYRIAGFHRDGQLAPLSLPTASVDAARIWE